MLPRVFSAAIIRGTAATVAVAAAVCFAVPASGATASEPVTSPHAERGQISATFLDPYDVYGAAEARVDAMFGAQSAAGIDTVIVQWSGWRHDDGRVSTTYPAGADTGYGLVDPSLPSVLASARRHGIAVWVGLLLTYDLLDAPATRSDTRLLDEFSADTVRLARDLYRLYGDQIVGWYLPTEPGDSSVGTPELLELHTRFLATITEGLDGIDATIPTMVSPSVPRAVVLGQTGAEFVSALEPMIRDAGVDVWNLQVGHEMTDWTPADDVALIRTGQDIAARYGASVWADIYTPGPGRTPADAPDPGYPTDPGALKAELDALAPSGVPIATWTFDDAMNPDPARGNAGARSSLYQAYLEYRQP